MYWIVMLDNISSAVGIAGTLLLIASGIFTFVSLMMFSDGRQIEQWPKAIGRWLLIPAFIGVSFCFGCWFIPGTKQMATIIVVPKLVNAIEGNKKLMGLPDKIVSLADDWLDTLKPKEEKTEAETGKK